MAEMDFFAGKDNVNLRISSYQEGVEPNENVNIRIAYIDAHPPSETAIKGTILLIHGFPQTSYQFRHVIPLFTNAGYRLIVPDYRGAGDSSKPTIVDGYRKRTMAKDLHHVIKKDLKIEEAIHVVGHDIGGMVAHAYAAHYPNDTASVTWGECPLPGTKFYKEIKESLDVWHFVFHRVTDLPEVLIAGNEYAYVKYFIDKHIYNRGGVTPDDINVYAKAYSAPGAMRSGLNVYRMFDGDATDNREMRDQVGKSQVRCLVLSGDRGFGSVKASEEAAEFYENFETVMVKDSGHWVAEENPQEFAEKVLAFVNKS